MFTMKITGHTLTRCVAKMRIFKILQQAVLKVTKGGASSVATPGSRVEGAENWAKK